MPNAVRRLLVTLLSLVLVLAPMQFAWADRTKLSPSWTVFSQEEEAAYGREAAQQVEQRGRMLNDRRVDEYVNQLGQKLAVHAPGYKYHYQYKVVNDGAINAFALPAGFVYVNRGLVEAVSNEAQLAAVLAHETAHIALRHGTAQVTKTYAWQFPLDIFGATLGGYSLGGLLVQLGAGLTVGTILLGNSRSDESEADVLGTQILFDSGYDPRAMGQFFEKIQDDPRMNDAFQFFFRSSQSGEPHRAGQPGGGQARGATAELPERLQCIRERQELPEAASAPSQIAALRRKPRARWSSRTALKRN
jgi:predicted Zn-dependent protease